MKNIFEFFTSFCLVVLIAVAVNDHWPVQPAIKPEQSESAQLQKEISADKIAKLEKELKQYKRKNIRLVRSKDSLTMEHIRKDGLLGDSSSFIITRFN